MDRVEIGRLIRELYDARVRATSIAFAGFFPMTPNSAWSVPATQVRLLSLRRASKRFDLG
jgi:hypothetical protein